ncbi:unnamed protein product, partial [Phaeothamnion confervicola]
MEPAPFHGLHAGTEKKRPSFTWAGRAAASPSAAADGGNCRSPLASSMRSSSSGSGTALFAASDAYGGEFTGSRPMSPALRPGSSDTSTTQTEVKKRDRKTRLAREGGVRDAQSYAGDDGQAL